MSADYDATLVEPPEREWCLLHGMSKPCDDCADTEVDRSYQAWKESRRER